MQSGRRVAQIHSGHIGFFRIETVDYLPIRRNVAQIIIGAGIVGVDDGNFGRVGFAIRGVKPPEQRGFGLAVGFPRAVIVQMLMGDVGDNGHIEIAAGEPVLRQPVRGGFQHGMGRAIGDHLRQVRLHLIGGRRGGVQARIQAARADLRVDGADHAGVQIRRAQDAIEQIGRRSLAIRAGDADQRELARGEIVQRSAEPTEGARSIRDQRVRRSGRQREFREWSLAHNRRRARRQRLRNEAVPITVEARNGDENAAGLHLPGIRRHSGNLGVRLRAP